MPDNTEKKELRSGMVSIVGRPNVGKSTLLNEIIGKKIAIVSPVPQTTRNQVRGIYNDARGQIVFIDTPGVHRSQDDLDRFMSLSAKSAVEDVDCLLYLVDTNESVGRDEAALAAQVAAAKVPVVMGLNKVDLKGKHIPEYVELWEKTTGKAINEIDDFTLLPLSSKSGLNVEKLKEILFSYLPAGPALYPEDAVFDVPQRMVISDIIREKFLLIMRDEIPHSLAVIIEDMRPQGKVLNIKALVLVERDSQKMIVIGKQGAVLKRVGTAARKELEEMLKQKIFLEIYVKDRKDWRNDPSYLREMGYLS